MSQIAEISLDAGYEAAQHGLAYCQVPNPGTLLIGGATRAEYLQRQTTNDLGLLSPVRAVPSMLTNASGRILEVFRLVQLGETIALLTQPGHAPGLAAYFKKHLFFNDQVTIEDASGAWAQIELRGPQAAALLAKFGFGSSPALDELASAQFAGQTIYAFGIVPFTDYPAFNLLLPDQITNELDNQLTASDAIQLSPHSRELLRIEAGLAGEPEFSDANTPYEIGLARYVSESKGCYTGQEVLARQVTYDKIVRSLALISAELPLPLSASVSAEGKTVGNLSSAAISPTLGSIALAVLRKPYEGHGTQLQVGSIPAKVL